VQLSDITFELITFAIYLAMVVGSYKFLTRIFIRIVDPKREYNLDHGVPLPTVIRWLILAMALIIPVMIASGLAAFVRFFV
jgi:hypothetical protein